MQSANDSLHFAGKASVRKTLPKSPLETLIQQAFNFLIRLSEKHLFCGRLRTGQRPSKINLNK